jgi:hypothetical protein
MARVHRRGRGFGILVALVVSLSGAALARGPAAAPRTAPQPTITAQVGDTPGGQAMGPGFVGVSFEYKAMHEYTGRDPRRVNPVLVQLLRQLVPGQAPVIRVGGDSTDSTWWPVRGVIPPNGVNYALSKGWMRTTQALAGALGAKLIMGINLAAGRPALAAVEARALLQGIGRRYVQALEIGNEPDLYNVFSWYRDRRGRVVFSRSRRYDLQAFTADFSHWRAAIPSVPLAGPTFSSLSWMPGLATFLSAERSLAVVTFHRYPLRGCVSDPSSPVFPSIPNLLADTASAGLAQGVAPYVAVAHAHLLPFRLDELNSASCTGRRTVSDTFASALWMLDTLFNMAAVGVDGVNIHTLPGAPYQPFNFTHPASGWQAFVHPDYYGMLMFGEAFPPGAKLLPVTVPAGPVKVWATAGADGRTRALLINKDPGASVVVQLRLAGTQSAATTQSLLAPGLSATSGVTLGGQTFGTSTSTGTLAGTATGSTIHPLLGTYSVSLPAASAVLLTR